MRPLLLGYLNPRPFTSAGELDALKRELAAYADKEDFTLADIYIEQIGVWDSAFNALIEACKRDGVQVVAVLTLYHLARLPRLQRAMKEHLERETGAQVLVMYPTPEGVG
ncbi:conserved hypothetical protein [Frankia canadensis]|uniref:Resolvase/invertase-type recombinase catalytic domain-containing protein n=1 Tax=Frankia canadensis TaxID=1836972 RepID=A0A2I2KPC5_9ACTN|nr:recombinase family protein [Frankia canadensis]SNQ47518.1 conserved hypothetical protein [Frankia canadensis]SOU54808.1 conserved hypothetical protein [Frankia canadensis]